jgi:uncharacterized protein (TIGR02996 family)
MADTDAFVRAILDDPADDAPRLVLADYLEERGSAQGAFIRVQCERARLDSGDARVPGLLVREAALLAAHRHEWLRPMHALLAPDRAYPGLPLQDAEFRRGLVEAIRVEALAFLRHADDLMLLGPVRELCLVGMTGNAPETARLAAGLAKLDCWGQVEVLGLRLWHWSESVVSRFLGAVEWPRLRELRLYGTAIDRQVMRRLVAWPAAHRLHRICVRSAAGDAQSVAEASPLRDRFDFSW